MNGLPESHLDVLWPTIGIYVHTTIVHGCIRENLEHARLPLLLFLHMTVSTKPDRLPSGRAGSENFFCS